MATENKILMGQAREALKNKWGIAVGGTFVYFVVSLVINIIPKLRSIISLLVGGPLVLGLTGFFLNIARDKETKVSDIFEGFNKFTKALSVYLLMGLFVILWSLLLVVPGIIAAISYSMAYYIMIDDSNIKPMEAINKSKKMMYGYKWKFFCLNLRFIGWALLCVLTLGIGLLWLMPYINVTLAKFYDDIKNNVIEKEIATA